MTIRMGMIGAGRIGRAHLESWSSLPEVQIAAVCDSDRSLAESAAEPFGATVHIDFRTLLEAEHLDAVCVCLPPIGRGEPEILAARAGIHLFVAGTIALNIEKARQVQKEVESAGIVTCVAGTWRYLSGTDRARELLGEKRIGLVRGQRFGPAPPEGWRTRRESSGGYFAQEAVDLIDLARYLVGDVTHVSAMRSEGIVAAAHPGYDIEDALVATLRFRNGAVGEIVTADVVPYERTVLAVVSEEGELRITPEALETFQEGAQHRQAHTGDPLRKVHETFLQAVNTGKTGEVRCDYADAVRTLEVILAAEESVQAGKVIAL